jgi:hypothetical protein
MLGGINASDKSEASTLLLLVSSFVPSNKCKIASSIDDRGQKMGFSVLIGTVSKNHQFTVGVESNHYVTREL